MSNQEQVTTHLDWREQYSQYLPQTETAIASPHYGQVEDFDSVESPISEIQYGQMHSGTRNTVAQPDSQEGSPNRVAIPLPDSGRGAHERQAENDLDASGPAKSTDRSLPCSPGDSLSPTVQLKREYSADREAELKQIAMKEGEEEDYEDEDDEMLDCDDGSGAPQTEAERRAERRKMKRFRLTHQQTRFLMSEFAKQAHPDAAHRERLSREIPGLSPRQVQVWFQNRRAKIKRLTADDRERMLKMRAVPDDFDNIQALHSPYGAVHGIGTPLASPVDYTPSYGQGVMRPLVVDSTQRQESGERHVSQAGLSSSFGNAGYTPSGSMASPDVLSPLSVNSGERFYGSLLSSPLSAGSQSTNPFNRQNSKDNYSMHSQQHNSRSLQPLQLRGTMSRSRSHSLQSPLRSSMSWKGDALDYAEYATALASPNLSRRQQSQYQPEQSTNPPVTSQNYDASTNPNSNALISPSQVTYTTPQSSSMQSPVAGVPIFHTSSSGFTPEFDVRSQYRGAAQQSNSSGAPPLAHRGSSNGSFATSTTGFASAPLKTPSDFRLPRTMAEVGPRDYHLGQLSAPMVPPQDFVNAYNHMAHHRRESVGESALNMQQSQQQLNEGSLQVQTTQNEDFLRPDNFGDPSRHSRKRTFSMPVSFDGL